MQNLAENRRASSAAAASWSAPAKRSDDGAFERGLAVVTRSVARSSKAVSRFACHRTPRPYGISICAAAVALISIMLSQSVGGADATVQLITLDPGHFHASLVQKFMYPQVSSTVRVYAPAGPDLQEHLKRIESFNTRADNPTRWQEIVHAGPDFLERMVGDKAGNVVVISGNNERKMEYIDDSIKAGFNVLADKPMAITPAGFDLLRKAFARAAKKKVLLYDIMTERYEITTILQRELAGMPELFGTLKEGTLAEPAVEMVSTHHIYKEVAGKPLTRPPWFFDARQQGEAVPDVGTHLVDLVQWECFPGQALDWRKDIKVLEARHWPTRLTLDQFKRNTGLDAYPDFLKPNVDANGELSVDENGEASYTVRGVHAKVTVLWRFEAPPGAKDMHNSVMRGTRATLTINQGPDQGYQPTLYIEDASGDAAADFERKVRDAVAKLSAVHPGVEVKAAGSSWQVVVPEKYDVGHEAHFAQVTENFLRFLAEGRLPDWETPNMLAKYYTTTEAYRLGHKADQSAAR
jgi:predicted dehydrogenase